MPLKTTEQQLQEVQDAITDVMSVQQYREGDLSVQKAMLSALTAREEILLTRFGREKRGGGLIRSNWSQGV